MFHSSTRCLRKSVRRSPKRGRILSRQNVRWVQRMVRKQVLEQSKLRTSDVTPVVALCTAESYNFAKLYPYLQNRYSAAPPIDDVAHIRVRHSSDAPETDIFFFCGSGSFVTWAPPDTGSFLLNLREELRPFEVKAPGSYESEEMQFRMATEDSGEVTGIKGETVIIEPNKDTTKIKLAFSNGLADSVKVSFLETMMEAHIDKVRAFPSMLQHEAKIKISRHEVLSLTGQLLHFRALVNLDSEIIDPPDRYWSEPQLENLYNQMSRFLETRQRVSVLNKKLDYVNELTSVLRSELSERHGLKLEWMIILLIFIEVIFGCLEWAEKLGYLLVG